MTFLADKVRFDRYAAALDVGMYIERPTYVLGYLIGMQEIEPSAPTTSSSLASRIRRASSTIGC